MRALVTGLAGFTGRYVASELESAGYEVWGVGDHASDIPRFLVANLSEPEGLKRAIATVQPSVVVHLAAIAFVGHGDAEAFYRVNLVGTRNLLSALVESGCKLDSVLLASSANIYGNTTVEVIDESLQPAPANDYAVSKLAMEYMARLWLDKLPIVMTRPFNYTGVGQSLQFLLPKIVDHFRRGERVIELGNIDVERDFSDVRSVANAYRRLVQGQHAGEIVNVCSGQAWSLKSVLAMMAEIAGYEIEVKVNPTFVRSNEVRRLRGDSTRLKGLIGHYSVAPLRETLRWMYEAAPVSR